jgi:methionine-rich copper-binding protein CopC
MSTAQNGARARYLAILLALVLGVGQAQGHAKLVSSDPAPDATVSALKLIQLHFSEDIAKKFSSIRLTNTDGNAIAIMAMTAPDAKSLAVMPNAALPPGLYTISWTAVATDDGHKTMGTLSFTVK